MTTRSSNRRKRRSLAKARRQLESAMGSLRAKADALAEQSEKERIFAEKAVYELRMSRT